MLLAIRDGRFAVYGFFRDDPDATFDPTVAGPVRHPEDYDPEDM